jgi:hypothetical protein
MEKPIWPEDSPDGKLIPNETDAVPPAASVASGISAVDCGLLLMYVIQLLGRPEK